MPPLTTANPCADGEHICNWVWDVTGNETAADWSDIFIGLPLALLGLFLLGLIVRWVLHKVVDRLMRRAEAGVLPDRVSAAVSARRAQRAMTIGSVLKSVITIVLIAVFGTMMLSEIGVNIAPIIASAGIIGIALGFGAQSLVRDFLSGIFMIFEDQYGVGDVVDVGEATGTIEAVTLRVTRLRDLSGTVWYVPNGEILRVGNMSQNWARAVVDVSVGYAEDLARVKRVLAEVAHDLWEDEDFSRGDHRGAGGHRRRDVHRRRGEHPGADQDPATRAVGGRPGDAPADQGPLRPRGHRDPVPAARGVAPRAGSHPGGGRR